MEQFRDVFIKCSPEDAELLIEIVKKEVEASSKCTIDEEQMKYSKGIGYGDGLGYICVNYASSNKSPTLTFLHSPPGRLYIPNIIPNEGQLSYSEYNSVFSVFIEQILKPAINKWNRKHELKITEETVRVSTVLPEILTKLLTSFSSAANKGSTHWADEERWRKFIIEAYRNSNRPSGSLLNRLLKEELGWSAERASDLVIEYEFGLELLKDYDNQQR